jgi:hypothetical protein
VGRPQKPIENDGPVAELAVALRSAREQAGEPGYRDMARNAHVSHAVLAAAAAGTRCPTWEMVKAYAGACGADPAAFMSLWQRADHEQRRRKHGRPRASRTASLADVRPLRPKAASAERSAEAHKTARTGPDPWKAQTPAQFTRQLRALRAWGGNPRLKASYVSPSSFYDAISKKRTTMPPLPIVQALVQACGANVTDWIEAWRALSLAEFERANPLPPAEPGGHDVTAANDEAAAAVVRTLRLSS